MESRNCLVCTVPITVTHLGIDACRACAAFFKRSKIADRSYTCRQGDGKCVFRKHEKFMCRSCRYDRCVELGMAYVLPPKRKPRKRVEIEEMAPSTSSGSTSSSSESMLERMESEYRASYDRRLVQEKHYIALHKIVRINHPTEELYQSSISSFYDIFRITIKEAIHVLQNVFDEFDHLSFPHRKILFKHFLGRFCMCEGVYLSSKYFKNNLKFVFYTSTSFMTTLLTFVDGNNPEQWVSEDDAVERKEDFRTALSGFATDYISLLGPMLKMELLTEREFHALLVLAYCDIDPSLDLPEELITNAERTKTKLFEELQDYYKNELRLSDFSGRLGGLMTFAHGAGEAGNLMSEEMRMYATMFDVYSDDQLSSASRMAEFVATAFEHMLFCRTHVDETIPSPPLPLSDQPTLHLSEFEEASISPTPRMDESVLCPAHYLSPLPHVVVQPPPNLKGAQSARVLTHAFSISDHSSPVSLTVSFVSDGIRTVTTGPMSSQSSNGPTRALRVHAPPRYSRN
uniref:Nuclear receptor n=1 Tax=Pristionchus pacificus TaxID=54126 RepID=A0A2A6CMT6_PRIPA